MLSTWPDLLRRLQVLGVDCRPLDAAEIDALPLDVHAQVAELLTVGWPRSSCAIGTCDTFGPIVELVAGLPLDWPRHLLPLCRRGPEALGWDARTGRVIRVHAGHNEPEGPAPTLAELLAWMQGWFDVCGREEVLRVGSWAAMSTPAMARLVERVGQDALQTWLFQGLGTGAVVYRSLATQRRQAMATARWTSIVVGLAPVIGYVGGSMMDPPQPALAGGIALLVVGSAPSILMAQAVRRAGQLARDQDLVRRLG